MILNVLLWACLEQTIRKMPVEYKLMTCLPKAFPVFSPFSFSSRCLYSAYVLLMISSLALSTLSCVNLCPNKCALPMLMMFFKHSRFLCRSILSFGVSTMSPKNSLSFNMSPTSAIIFIKCRNRCHMKNNIRCKGNTNNISVIIFLKSKVKNSQRWYFAWENLRGGYCDVGCHIWSWFHFCIFISFLIFILLLFFICFFFIHICFSTSSLTLSWTIAGFLRPFYTFSPAHRRVIHHNFVNQPFRYLLAESATALSGHFFTHRRFLPYAPSPIF